MGEWCVCGSRCSFFILAILLILSALLLAIWLIFFVFIPLVILPVIEVFSLWGSRITIVRWQWKKNLLLRNLQNPDEFLAEIGSRVPINHIKKQWEKGRCGSLPHTFVLRLVVAPATSGNALILRTKSAVYRVE